MFTEAGTILEQAREYYENINHHLQKTTIIQKTHSKIRITLNAKKENLPIEESSSSLSFSHPAFLSSLWGIIYSIKFHQAFQETHGIWKTQRISMKNFKVLLVSEVTIWIFLFKHIQWYNNKNNLQESNLLKKKKKYSRVYKETIIIHFSSWRSCTKPQLTFCIRIPIRNAEISSRHPLQLISKNYGITQSSGTTKLKIKRDCTNQLLA